MNAIFHRVSIRKYQQLEVEDEKIEQILKAAMAAPSASNQQPWEFYVVINKQIIEKLSKASQYAGCAKEAPLVFVPCYRDKGIDPDYFEIDLSAAVENMLLQIDTLGLGAVWIGIAPVKERMENVRKVLDLPDNLSPFALVPCGYPVKGHAQQNRYDTSRIHYVK